MGINHVTALECVLCERQYDPDRVVYTCPEHEGVSGILEVKTTTTSSTTTSTPS
jgi:threonine synthase